MPDYPQEAWIRLGKIVRDERLRLDFNQDDVKARSGGRISRAVWSDIERGVRTNYDERSLYGLCVALDWKPFSVALVLDGQDPVREEHLMPALVTHDSDGTSMRLTLSSTLLTELLSMLVDTAQGERDPEIAGQARQTLLDVQEALAALPADLRLGAPPPEQTG